MIPIHQHERAPHTQPSRVESDSDHRVRIVSLAKKGRIHPDPRATSRAHQTSIEDVSPSGPAGLFCSGNFGFETIACRWGIKLALEGAVERRLGFVTDLTGNLRDTAAGRREKLRP